MNNEAIRFFKAFCEQITEWEKEGIPVVLSGNEAKKEILREKLKLIYETFLTKKDRKTGKLTSLNCNGDFDLSNIDIIDIEEGKKIHILYNKNYPNNYSVKNKITIVVEPNSYLIDKREIYDSSSQKWKNIVF